jgi:glucuronate isomerase
VKESTSIEDAKQAKSQKRRKFFSQSGCQSSDMINTKASLEKSKNRLKPIRLATSKRRYKNKNA